MYMRCIRFLTFMSLTLLMSVNAFTVYECHYSENLESRECSEKEEPSEKEVFEKEILYSSFYSNQLIESKNFSLSFSDPIKIKSDVCIDIIIPPPDFS